MTQTATVESTEVILSAPDLVLDLPAWALDLVLRHPDLTRVEPAVGTPCDGEPMLRLGIWLSELSDAAYDEVTAARQARGRARPDRRPDLELGGDFEVHPTFFDRLPDLEAYSLIQDFDWYEDEPGFWAARIWLRSPLDAVHAA